MPGLPDAEVVRRAERALGLTFHDPTLIVQALVHRSFLNESSRTLAGSNERLEYLGDAVLELIVSDYLYHLYPRAPEGVLSAMRAALVRAQTLGRIARNLGLGDLLSISKGEATTGARSAGRILGQTYEAVLGAIYLDQGLEVARAFVLGGLGADLARVEDEYRLVDPKTRLRDLARGRFGESPMYELVATTGPGHRPRFTYEARVRRQVIGVGDGETKQEAEEAAARQAIVNLEDSPPANAAPPSLE